MRITIESTELARGQLYNENPVGMAINGEDLIQEVELFRNEEMRFINRGNLRTNLTFGVHREFSSIHDAQLFRFTHRSVLSGLEGVCIITLEHINPAISLAMDHAVLGGVSFPSGQRNRGISTWAEYTISGGLVKPAGELPGLLPSIMRSWSAEIPAGQQIITIEKSFPESPSRVVCHLSPPNDASPVTTAWVLRNTITANSFQVRLGAALPSSGYHLDLTAYFDQ